jgi:hypothetical protein
MKQKYHIRKNAKEEKLIIQEFAALTANIRKQKFPAIQDDEFSLLCEQTYHGKEVKKAALAGKDELIMLLRNRHFFPIGIYMDKIADSVIAMYALKDDQHEDLIFDDKEVLIANQAGYETVAEIEDQAEDESTDNNIDNFIEDDSQPNETPNSVDTKHEPYNEDKK